MTKPINELCELCALARHAGKNIRLEISDSFFIVRLLSREAKVFEIPRNEDSGKEKYRETVDFLRDLAKAQ